MRSNPLTLLTFLAGSLLSPLALPAVEQVAVNPANGRTYCYSSTEMNWTQWRTLTDATGGYLVCFGDAAEEDWVDFAFSSIGGVCIGLTDEVTEGTFLWESGEALVYQHWLNGSPAAPPLGDTRDHVMVGLTSSNLSSGWGDWQGAARAVIEYESTPTPAVTGLSVTSWPLTLHWQNPIVYDSIEVYRIVSSPQAGTPDVLLLATLPGNSTELVIPNRWGGTFAIIGKSIGSPSLPRLLYSQAEGAIVNPASGRTYFRSPERLHWKTWQAMAGAIGGYLVSIEDAAEQAWLADNLPDQLPGGDPCIGLTDEVNEGTFLWESGEPFSYQNWHPSHPLGPPQAEGLDYVKIEHDSGAQWVNTQFGGEVVIEYESPPTPAVTGLAVANWPPTLVWQNPIAFDSIEVYRIINISTPTLTSIATLPGTATEFVAPDGTGWKFAVVGKRAGTAAQFSMVEVVSTHLYIPPSIIVDDAEGGVRVMLDDTASIQGWAFGVCHDPSSLSINAISMGEATATVNGGNPPFFRSASIYDDGCTVAVLINPQGNNSLPAGWGYELEVLTVEALVPAPATATLEFCNTLGAPPVQVATVVDGLSIEPYSTDGVVEIRARHFIRGDANGSLSVDVADPVFVASWLFGGGETPDCLAAADSNGDLLLDIADVVSTLNYLFQAGPSPGAPFPDCGPDPVPALDCAVPPDCP